MANSDSSCERDYAPVALELTLRQPVLVGELKAFCLVAESCGYEADDPVTRRGSDDSVRSLAIAIDIQALAEQLRPGIADVPTPASSAASLPKK